MSDNCLGLRRAFFPIEFPQDSSVISKREQKHLFQVFHTITLFDFGNVVFFYNVAFTTFTYNCLRWFPLYLALQNQRQMYSHWFQNILHVILSPFIFSEASKTLLKARVTSRVM